MKGLKILLLFIIKTNLTLYSQHTITGTVKDESGHPLVAASVSLDHSSLATGTDSGGVFVIKNVTSGNNMMKISFLGYETISKNISVYGDMTLNFNMIEKSIITDKVIITAVRAAENAPVTKSSVSKDEIHTQNTGQDVPFLLALSPSAVSTSDAGAGVGYTSVGIRGTDETGINVTVNGIPINDAESHAVYWVDMPDIAASADNIQIQRGVGSSTQGAGAFGGTINFQTSGLNKKPYAELNNAYGSFNTLKNSLSFGTGLINEHFCFDGRLSKITSDGYIDRATSNLKSFYFSGAYYSDNSLLKIITFSGLEHTYQAWDGVPNYMLSTNRTYNPLGGYINQDGIVQYYNNQTDNYQQDNYQILYSRQMISDITLNSALHFTHGMGYYEEYEQAQNLATYGLDTIFLKNKTDTIASTDLIRRQWLDNVFYGFTGSLNYKGGKTNTIIGGGWNQYFGKHYGNVIWAQYMSDGEIGHQYYYSSGTKNDFNIFAKSTYSFNDRVTAFGDLQYRIITHAIKGVDDDPQPDGTTRDITQNHQFNFFNPKAGITYQLTSHFNFYGYIGIAHREPTRDDLVDATTGDPVPKPERLLDYETGVNVNFDLNNPIYPISISFPTQPIT